MMRIALTLMPLERMGSGAGVGNDGRPKKGNQREIAMIGVYLVYDKMQKNNITWFCIRFRTFSFFGHF